MPNLFTAPLFKKLMDENTEIPFEKIPDSFLSFEELQSSIAEELSQLLNTRISVFWKDYVQNNRTIPFSYGVDITTAIYTENAVEMRKLETHVENAIKTFEPRLIDPKAYIQGFGKDPSSLFINIDASVMAENRRIPMSFPIILNTS